MECLGARYDSSVGESMMGKLRKALKKIKRIAQTAPNRSPDQESERYVRICDKALGKSPTIGFSINHSTGDSGSEV